MRMKVSGVMPAMAARSWRVRLRISLSPLFAAVGRAITAMGYVVKGVGAAIGVAWDGKCETTVAAEGQRVALIEGVGCQRALGKRGRQRCLDLITRTVDLPIKRQRGA